MNNNQVVYPNQPIPRNQLLRLKQRTDAVNKLYARYGDAYQRMISIHIDSRSRGQNIDVFFYHHRNSAAGLRLAQNIHESFRQKYALHQPNRRYGGSVTPRSNLYVIRNTHPPAILIELGNLQNRRDQPRFIMSSNRQALANWIADGIIADYEEGRLQSSIYLSRPHPPPVIRCALCCLQSLQRPETVLQDSVNQQSRGIRKWALKRWIRIRCLKTRVRLHE